MRIPGPGLGAVAATFGPFGILLSAALLAAELKEGVDLHRAVHSVWLSIAFATPAFALFILEWPMRPSTAPRYQYWRLTWTFAFLSYAVHFYYSFFVIFRGSVRTVLEQQTPFVAWSNFAFTGGWALDVLLHWLPAPRPGLLVASRLFQVFAFVVFTTAFLFLRPGIPQVLALIMLSAAALAALRRASRGPQGPSTDPPLSEGRSP